MIIPPVFVPVRPSGRPCGDGGSRSREARAAAVDSDGLRPVLRGSTTARGASNADQITSSISNRVDEAKSFGVLQVKSTKQVQGGSNTFNQLLAVFGRELTFIKIYIL